MPVCAVAQQLDRVNQHQIVQRAGIRDDVGHVTSEAKPFERVDLAVQVGQRVGLEHAVSFQEAVNLVQHRQVESVAEFILGDAAGTVFLQHQRLERTALQVAACFGEAGGHSIWDAEGQVHGDNLYGDGAGVIPAHASRASSIVTECGAG